MKNFLIIILTLCVALSACGTPGTETRDANGSAAEQPSEATGAETAEPEAPAADDGIDRTCYPYEEELHDMTDDVRAIYDEICPKVLKYEPFYYDVKTYGYDFMDNLLIAYGAINERHLETRNYFMLKEINDDEGMLVAMESQYVCLWDPEMSDDIEEVKAGMAAFERKADEIVSRLSDDMTAYQKYLYLAMIISRNADYDYDNYAFDAAAPWGGVMGGYSICEGFSVAMQYLCRRANLYCKVVEGLSQEVSHAWNLVKLPEGTYHVDITWSDGRGDPGSWNWLTCFMLTQEQIEIDHIVTDGTVATGTERY